MKSTTSTAFVALMTREVGAVVNQSYDLVELMQEQIDILGEIEQTLWKEDRKEIPGNTERAMEIETQRNDLMILRDRIMTAGQGGRSQSRMTSAEHAKALEEYQVTI